MLSRKIVIRMPYAVEKMRDRSTRRENSSACIRIPLKFQENQAKRLFLGAFGLLPIKLKDTVKKYSVERCLFPLTCRSSTISHVEPIEGTLQC